MLKVQAKQCSTCIYRRDSSLDLTELERQVADPHMDGFFKGHRICHHSKDVCCRGFWNRHKDKFTLGQIAQRLGLVLFVNGDDNRRRSTKGIVHGLAELNRKRRARARAAQRRLVRHG